MARSRQKFQTIRSEGGLLPPDILLRLIDSGSKLPGLRPEDYALAPGERLHEAITQSWNRCRRYWTGFRAAAVNLLEGEAGTGLTNDKWSLPLLRELGFGLLPTVARPMIAGRAYPVRRFMGPTAIHLVGCGLSLDRRAAGQRGAATANPHGLVQDLLNRSDDHLWAIVSNGRRLRILRDNSALSRQSYLEFDLDAMFSGEVYSDFVLLWLVAHATRFTPRDNDTPQTCWLEDWTREAERQGARALGELRGSVERVLQILGEGFTSHPRNVELRDALRAGDLALDEFHGQLLRVVYRLIFLFVAEDRVLDGEPLLHPPDDSAAARVGRERYAEHYGTARLRNLAGKIKGSRHGDLWRQFQLLVGALSGDPDFETVRRTLALPALGSFLWNPDSTAALNDAELTNYNFLEALRRLAFIRSGKVLRPVDYRNLGAEELGGVYESLLGLTPQINGGGARFTFAEFAGNARKTSGSYYTPDELVQCLLDTALDPVVEAAVRGKTGAEAEQAILDLKVCDPAVGSGHFLVGTAHRLARRLARVRAYLAGDSEPSPPLYQHALRDVIGRCLYGVDVNPMAAELCRVSLWLEALEPGKPLSFLDHHIRVGNSLLGATPELVAAGLPDEAFKPIQGDDKRTCSLLRKRNKRERKSSQRDMRHLMVAEPRAEYGGLAELRRDLDTAPDDTLDEVRRKEAQFQGLVVSPKYRERQRVADAWCAAFVWSKRTGDDPPCITTNTLRALRADPDALTSDQHREVECLAGRYRFFHWDLAFPEVFENGGFDCVLGNPPWEKVKLQEKEWFAERKPEIADASTAVARKQMIQALTTDDLPLYRRFLDDLRKSEGWSHLMHNTGRYPLCGRGDINLYAVFSETMRNVVNDRGRAGCVLPTGIATDDTTKLFFQNVVETGSLVSLFDFENKGVFFPGVHSSYKFCLFTTGKGQTVHHRPTVVTGLGQRSAIDGTEFVFFAHAVEELRDPERRFTLSHEDIALLNPNTRTCPIFRSRKDAELTTAIYRRVPVLVREARDGRPVDNPWGIRFSTMFHMSNDSHLFRTRADLEAEGWELNGNVFHRNRAEHLPLYEAKMIHIYDHRWATLQGKKEAGGPLSPAGKLDPSDTVLPRYWVEAREVYRRTADLPKDRRWLMGWRDITNTTNERTVVGGVFPLVAVGNNLPMWTATTEPAQVLSSLLSSVICDFAARIKVGGTHLNFFIAKQIPVLPPKAFSRPTPWSQSTRIHEWLLPRILELTFTSWDLELFANDCGHHGSPFRWNEDRRFLLRCELDAAFFHLYLPADEHGHWLPARRSNGCPFDETSADLTRLKRHFAKPRDAVAYVMDSFPIVRRKDEQKVGEYRTKQVILENYDAMQEAIVTGAFYQTRLDPAPADPMCCHPPREVTHEPPAIPANLPDGAWAGPIMADPTDYEITVLAAVLKAFVTPAPIHRVRLASVLVREPRLLTPSLPANTATDWCRLIGRDAEQLPQGVARLRPEAYHWGVAVRQLRGSGGLVENLDAKTWGPGPPLKDIEPVDWADGRVHFILKVLQGRDDEIGQTLPEDIREWIHADAA